MGESDSEAFELYSKAKCRMRNASPEIEDILLPHSLVSGVCYIAVG